jgi:hypothetical protein
MVHELATVSTKSHLIKLILTEGDVFAMFLWEIRRTKEIRNRLEGIKH